LPSNLSSFSCQDCVGQIRSRSKAEFQEKRRGLRPHVFFSPSTFDGPLYRSSGLNVGKMIPHRSTALLSVIVFVALLLFIFSSSPVPDAGEQSATGPAKFVPTPKLPSLSNFHLPSFRPPSHEQPEEQTNSTHGESKWYSTLEWLNPFSSAITLDENRSVLPPLRERRPIYTYYDAKYNPNKSNGKDLKDLQNADAELLLAWRRAWFAQGFKPVVLTPGDAMKTPTMKLFRNGNLRPKHRTRCSLGLRGGTWAPACLRTSTASLWRAMMIPCSHTFAGELSQSQLPGLKTSRMASTRRISRGSMRLFRAQF